MRVRVALMSPRQRAVDRSNKALQPPSLPPLRSGRAAAELVR